MTAAARVPTAATDAPAAASESAAGARTLVFESHGVRIGIRATHADILARVHDHLPPGARPCAAERVDELYSCATSDAPAGSAGLVHVLVRQHAGATPHEVARGPSAALVLAAFRRDSEFRVALHAPELLFVHAAVVGWQGRALIVPGRSFAGKSTLAAALLACGAEYYSDEYAVIDALGQVHPFARPLQLRAPDRSSSRWMTPAEIGARVGAGPIPLGLVVATSYDRAAHWDPAPMTAGATALALLDNALVARLRPAHALARIAAALRPGVVGLCGARGEADATAALLLARATLVAASG